MTTTTDRELVARRSAPSNGQTAAAPQSQAMSKHGISFVTADEIGAKVSGPIESISAEQRAAANEWISSYKQKLVDQTAQALEQREEGRAQLGGPIVSTYVGYDIVSVSPIQFNGFPPYSPHKIVAGGELMMLQALQWINPRVSIPEGFAIPATTQLGGRHLRVRFDQLNLTTGTAGPSFNFNINPLPNPAPTFILFALFMVAPPVSDTQLFEVNVTSDIVGMSQPYAAFATWHQDVDSELPWLAPAPPGFPVPLPPRMLNNTPMRYMVFPQ